jgi:uncharacterized protein (TIGR03034 family)
LKNSLCDHSKNAINAEISKSRIPKLNIWDDSGYVAKVTFTGQDHFGLDKTDITSMKFHYIRAFRIWFVLHRWEKVAYKPFFTNMKAALEISGRRNR